MKVGKNIAAVANWAHVPRFRFHLEPFSRGIVVFGADLWASDWEKMTPEQQLKLLTGRLDVARKGIILLHDPRAQTAAMLPAFLRYLRDNKYRVVHIVPAARNLGSAAQSH